VLGSVAGVVYVEVVWNLYEIDSQTCFDPGCPDSQVPLGTALGFGSGYGSCGTVSNASGSVCRYTFNLTAGSGISPEDVTLELLYANIYGVGYINTVSLDSARGCTVATWAWSAGARAWTWGAPVGPSCVDASPSAPFLTGETLVLDPVNDTSLWLSDRGYSLVAEGSGDFEGTVGAPIR
jgi:hypothetical protein